MEKKIETLAELKGEEVRLRDKMESGIDKTTKTAHDWLKAQRKVKALEAWLLWTIVSLMLILFIGGCYTMKGAFEDTSWILRTTADNIQPKQEK